MTDFRANPRTLPRTGVLELAESVLELEGDRRVTARVTGQNVAEIPCAPGVTRVTGSEGTSNP